ncbi:MAG TPA: hypothetical protein VIM81_06790 [Gammaproteobacteria bacterium]
MKRSIRAARSIAVTAGVVAAAALGTAREREREEYVRNAERDSLRRGEELFRSTTLGTNGQACARAARDIGPDETKSSTYA